NLPTLKIRQLSNFVPTTLEKLQLPHLAATPFQICQLSNFANSENSSSWWLLGSTPFHLTYPPALYFD
ncbi:hypothetical protein POG22_02165, partial [Geitlerinema sp. CS-897]|nr:hypothetical protein [Geitlerinema sp. CS-897]